MLVAEKVSYYADPPDDYAREICWLDVHASDHVERDWPVLVFIHGGGLEVGDRDEGDSYRKRMNDEGIGMVQINYRLSPRAQCPDYLMDSAAAVAWTLDHIGEFGGDPRKVFVTGMSAGGYLAPMICLDKRYLKTFGRQPADIRGCIPISGQMLTHFTIRKERGIPMSQPMIDEYAPLHFAHRCKMPMLCAVGDNDMPARVEENALFTAVRKAAGHADTTLLVVGDRDHNTIMGHWQDADDALPTAVLRFVRQLCR